MRIKILLIGFLLAFSGTPAAAKPLISVWKLEPVAHKGQQTVEFGKSFLEQRMIPARLVKTVGATEWAAGKILPTGTYLFKVFQDDGKAAYCSTKDQSLGNVAKSFFIPALDRRPCFIDANHDGKFEAVFTVFDKYGSALTPSGNISSAKPIPLPLAYTTAESSELPKEYNLSFVMEGSRTLEKFRVGVSFSLGKKGQEPMLVKFTREGTHLKLINIEVAAKSMIGNLATIDVTIDPNLILLGDSGGSFYGAEQSELPKDWNQ